VIARFGAFQIDSSTRQLTRNGAEVHLTPKAFDLLLMLIEDAPRVLRKQELHERLWPGTFVSDATLIGLVKVLRRALDERDSGQLIRTAHRVGYAFIGPFDKVATPSTISRWIVAGSRRYVLTPGENVLGRDPASAVFLDAPGVSRRHARIVVEGPNAILEDLGSKNGTVVDGQPLTGPVVLADGNEIQLGPATILYRASASGVSTETTMRNTRRRRADVTPT
jgi:DNA-binding winged helix-turn-helix (wHTH) protein